MTTDDDSWFDDDAGPLVRPFAVTRGRAGADVHDLDLITLVVAVRPAANSADWDWEYGEILRMCQGRPLSIAEIAAKLDLLLAAVKVLVSDLIDSGHLIFRSPPAAKARPDIKLLQAVLDGVRRL
ncbi:MAG TPA: DUF742 domain-containing protein [Amycolatopsis sp.]|nr:DUF742 domain-containing protein [Amycolatopsis sp.]